MRKFIELLESQLGYSEKSGGYTKFGDWYGKNVEFDADYTSAPWCDMYLSWAAEKLGYQEWIGQFAYTVHHAQWFRQQDAWGTVPKPGAIVFFDWRGSDKISHIDHVGIVTRVEGNRIHTIEGNIDGGVAKRKERDTGKVVGYGYPEKIKARLDREATEKQTIVTPATTGDNAVVIGPGPNLIAMVPAPAPTRETSASTRPDRNSEGATSKPTPGHTAATATGKAAPGGDAHAASGGNPAANTQRSDRATTKAPGKTQAPATGRTSPGKHAKASTADTSALAVTPTATARDLATPVPGFDTPAVLAPVLLAAAAILAHGKARQSRVRLLASASGRAAVAAPTSSSRRTPGRRRAPGRRRMPRNASARDLSYTPPPVGTPENTPVFPGLGNAPASPGTPENTLVSRDPLYAPIPADASENTPIAPDLGDPFFPSRRATSPREIVPESTFAPAAAAGFPSVTTSVAHVEEPSGRPAALSPVPRPRDDRPRAPYRGRRRLQEQAVAESSTWVQDSPPRGRRHRRADPVVTTVPAPPTRPARPVRPIAPTRSTTSARPVPGPRTAVPVSTVRTGRGEPAIPAASATLLAEPGDILVHSGYRGRRRAKTPV
ncbi:CHAP domain-containing protein [Streptosporangium sp. NPDC006930]|uniref:CHAP domain-containing protein n=1 Tax=Streptosporangium sp. NPDC006930 TaxID=3154783 RepID=UPI003441E858